MAKNRRLKAKIVAGPMCKSGRCFSKHDTTCNPTAAMKEISAMWSGHRKVNRFCGCTSMTQIYQSRNRNAHRLMPSGLEIDRHVYAGIDGRFSLWISSL